MHTQGVPLDWILLDTIFEHQTSTSLMLFKAHMGRDVHLQGFLDLGLTFSTRPSFIFNYLWHEEHSGMEILHVAIFSIQFFSTCKRDKKKIFMESHVASGNRGPLYLSLHPLIITIDSIKEFVQLSSLLPCTGTFTIFLYSSDTNYYVCIYLAITCFFLSHYVHGQLWHNHKIGRTSVQSCRLIHA